MSDLFHQSLCPFILVTILYTCEHTRDGFRASATFLGEKFPKAISTEWLILARREFFAGQYLLAVCTHETITMERYALVGNSTLVDDLTNE